MLLDKLFPQRFRPYLWALAFAALAALVVDRFDLLTVWKTVALPDGSSARLPNSWYTVDHPFHISRAHGLLEMVRDGSILRWFGEHQGGYPAEFYPTGAAWIDVALCALTFGQLPIGVVHKLMIAVVVLAPSMFYLWWTVRDRISPGVALLAGAGHVVIAGEWWSGGWTEIVLWGLVTNVAAQTAILGSLCGVLGWLKDGRSRDLGFAVLFAGLALGTNPRTALGLLAVGIAAVIVAAIPPTSIPVSTIAKRGLALVGLSFAAAAPVLISLLRFRDLYYFVHYSEYADLGAWWQSSKTALWEPVFWLALLGIVTGAARSARPITRTAAIAAVVYMGATALMTVSGAAIFDQLELTRLMPFQRMLLFYLAAVAVHDLIDFAILSVKKLAGHAIPAPGTSLDRPWICVFLGVSALALVYCVVIRPVSWVPDEQSALRPMGSSAQPATSDFESAVRLADASAPEGTAILVLGTVLSWHQGLTAPMWSDRRFFYDDWLWYWQRDHVGPYNPESEHAYPRDAATLTFDYFQTHGIGAVIITDVSGQANREAARSSPLLQLEGEGAWFDVLVVTGPVSIVSADGVNADTVSIDNHSIVADGESAGGIVIVRHNWHPRWSATVNGEEVDIVKRADGYMELSVPAGSYHLELNYAVTGYDWLARSLFMLAVLSVIALISGRPHRALRLIAVWFGGAPTPRVESAR